jgi:hypothetical protein
MEVGGIFYALTALFPGTNHPVHIVQEKGWASADLNTVEKRKISCVFLESNTDSSAVESVS